MKKKDVYFLLPLMRLKILMYTTCLVSTTIKYVIFTLQFKNMFVTETPSMKTFTWNKKVMTKCTMARTSRRRHLRTDHLRAI